MGCQLLNDSIILHKFFLLLVTSMERLFHKISVQVVLIILCKFRLFGEKFCQFFVILNVFWLSPETVRSQFCQ